MAKSIAAPSSAGGVAEHVIDQPRVPGRSFTAGTVDDAFVEGDENFIVIVANSP